MSYAHSPPPQPVSGCPGDGFVDREQVLLSEFASSLASFTPDVGIGEDGATHQDATLLLSLAGAVSSAAKVSEKVNCRLEAGQSAQKTDDFAFTCPSLSLETRPYPRLCGDDETHEEFPDHRPASLLSRPLKIDDRDALRLSTDAMARNVYQSFSKALLWRISKWKQSVSRLIVLKEKQLTQNKQEVKPLMRSREAKLIVALSEVERSVRVSGSSSVFRVEQDSGTPGSKRRKLESTGGNPCRYSSSQRLKLHSIICLDTPAGECEVSLEIPGSLEGIFSMEYEDTQCLKSVIIDLDTEILAAMIEKSCRTLVRSSVESVIKQFSRRQHSESSSDEEVVSMTTGLPSQSHALEGSAVVTPQRGFFVPSASPPLTNAVMMPMPEDFVETAEETPRRISPPPLSPVGVAPVATELPKHLCRRSLPMVSPPGSGACDFHEPSERGPFLPLLLEAARQAAT